VSGIVRSSDIPQTILGWVGAGSLENVDGVDLASTWRGPQTTPGVAYLESRATELNHGWSPLHGLRTEEYLYIRSPQPELYAVDSDPGQLQNLFDQVPDQAQHIASSLDLLLEQRLIDPQAATMVGLDTATRARLEALGYAMPNQPVPQTNLDPKQGRRTLARYAEVERLMNNALYEAAVRILEELLEVSPSSVRTQLLLTHAYLALDRLDAALEHAESATSLGPNRERTWRLLGIVRLERGQPGEASEAFRRAIEIDPATPGAQVRLVESLIAEGRIEAAKAQAARVTLLGFGNGRQLRRLADAWEAAGQSEMALDAYRRVLAIHPESPRDNMHFAIHLIRAGQQGVAEKHIALAGSEVTAQPKARHALAQAYLAIGDTEQARAVGWR
jgi:tetratricopeptide (TPR) repeat protein